MKSSLLKNLDLRSNLMLTHPPLLCLSGVGSGGKNCLIFHTSTLSSSKPLAPSVGLDGREGDPRGIVSALPVVILSWLLPLLWLRLRGHPCPVGRHPLAGSLTPVFHMSSSSGETARGRTPRGDPTLSLPFPPPPGPHLGQPTPSLLLLGSPCPVASPLGWGNGKIVQVTSQRPLDAEETSGGHADFSTAPPQRVSPVHTESALTGTVE